MYASTTTPRALHPTTGQLAELEAATCRLVDSLPSAFRDSFRVYDIGFYLHNETQQGGYPEAFQWAVDTVQGLSPVRQADGPEWGVYAVLDTSSKTAHASQSR